jgi:hypothetical protein
MERIITLGETFSLFSSSADFPDLLVFSPDSSSLSVTRPNLDAELWNIVCEENSESSPVALTGDKFEFLSGEGFWDGLVPEISDLIGEFLLLSLSIEIILRFLDIDTFIFFPHEFFNVLFMLASLGGIIEI